MAKSGGLNYGVPAKRDNSIDNKGGVINSYFGEGEILKLPDISIQKFYDELKTSIDRKTPRFLWSKERLNNKIRLDNDKQLLFLEKIRILRETIPEVNQLKADIFFSDEFVINLIANKRREAEQSFQLSIANHKKALTGIKVDIDLIISTIEHDQIEKDRKKLENDKLRLENEALKSKNDLHNLVVSKINLDKFSPTQIIYFYSVLIGQNVDAFNDLNIKEKLDEFKIKMTEEEFRKFQAEVNDFINSAEFKKWQFNRDKKAAEKNDKL